MAARVGAARFRHDRTRLTGRLARWSHRSRIEMIPSSNRGSLATPYGGVRSRVKGRAHDAGLVAQLGGHDFGPEVQQGQELVRLAAHPATDDEEVRPEQVLEPPVVLLQPLGPLFPRELLPI